MEKREHKEITKIVSTLNSKNKTRVKDIIRRIISAMTIGKDVSQLFPDIVKNMETEDFELKKLIYLYTINYAKQYPK